MDELEKLEAQRDQQAFEQQIDGQEAAYVAQQHEESEIPLAPEKPQTAQVPAEGSAGSVPPQRQEIAPVKRVLPDPNEHPDISMRRLEVAYMDVTGESMSAETRATMYAFMQQFGIRAHDSLMCLLVSNGHIDNRLQKIPHQLALVIEKGARDVLDGCGKAADDEAKKASLKLLQRVSEKIDEAQTGGIFRHIGWASPIFILGLLLGNMMGPMAFSKWLVSILF